MVKSDLAVAGFGLLRLCRGGLMRQSPSKVAEKASSMCMQFELSTG
jgi:hypothetical protein